MTPKATVTQAEVRRYLKAMREAGFETGRVEIERPDGTRVSIVAGKAGDAAAADANDIDTMIDRVPKCDAVIPSRASPPAPTATEN